jgi:hypothetical protein
MMAAVATAFEGWMVVLLAMLMFQTVQLFVLTTVFLQLVRLAVATSTTAIQMSMFQIARLIVTTARLPVVKLIQMAAVPREAVA